MWKTDSKQNATFIKAPNIVTQIPAIGHFRVLPCPFLFCGLVTLTSIRLGIVISGLSSSV